MLGAGELAAAVGAKYLVLIDGTYRDLETGRLVAPAQLDDDAWQGLIASCERVSTLAKDRFGLSTAFHPHVETHVEPEDQIEAFLDDTDPRLISICLDTGHHAYGGGDPVAFIRKHHDRISYLHLKNIDEDVRVQVDAEAIPFAWAVGMNLFCEPAVGAVDFAQLREALEEVDFNGWAVVERDMYPAPWDKPLPIARRMRQYLRDIGIG